MYRFYGAPLQPIKSKQSGKVLFVFDTKGEYLTDDENIIRRCLGFFDNIQLEAKDITKKESKTYNIPPMTMTTISPRNDTAINKEEPLRHCKKCDFTCTNQGELLTHYREQHQKEGK